MPERITPARVRWIAREAILGAGVAETLLALADQMEADERRTAYIQEAWRELGAEIAHLKDALSAYNAVINLLPANVSPSEWLRDMVAERDELAATYKLFADCMERARRMWQDAHPDRPLMWPDDAKNIVWLVEQHEALAAKLTALEEKMKGRVLVPVEYEIENDGTVSAFPTAAIGNAYLYPGNGADEAEALVNLQAAIDKEGANG